MALPVLPSLPLGLSSTCVETPMVSIVTSILGGIAPMTTGIIGGIGGLPQSITNGNSLLGTLQAPTLPLWLNGNQPPNTPPWGGDTPSNTNPYTGAPDTGMVRHYDFNVQTVTLAPDGVNKSMIVVNGAFPGPTIEANWGDTFEITVHNNIENPAEGTSLHWHGILQVGSEWYDGTPGVSGCPIPPGQSFTYRFEASLYGTSWWHAHYSAQLSNGIFGPIVVYGPSTGTYDIDLGPVVVTDWYHADYHAIVQQSIQPPPDNPRPAADDNLINGKGQYNCSMAQGVPCAPNAGLSEFMFQPGKVHRLRLINAGMAALQHFTIDGHTMTVIAEDFVPVQPYQTNVVTLNVGQRTDILVTGKADPTGSYYMRSDIANCSDAVNRHALAIIYYPKANQNVLPTSTPTVYQDICAQGNFGQSVPAYSMTPPTPVQTTLMNITAGLNSTNNPEWYVNSQVFHADFNNPLLEHFTGGSTDKSLATVSPKQNIYFVNGSTSDAVRIVFESSVLAQHPIHLHGHNFWILADGIGTWDGTTINSSNPPRRDVYTMQPGGYLVIEYPLNNPGIWPLHCHIAWHVSLGFQSNMIEHLDKVQMMQTPPDVQQNCANWRAYSGYHIVGEIDSGE